LVRRWYFGRGSAKRCNRATKVMVFAEDPNCEDERSFSLYKYYKYITDMSRHQNLAALGSTQGPPIYPRWRAGRPSG
jgi:hypothetical protein